MGGHGNACWATGVATVIGKAWCMPVAKLMLCGCARVLCTPQPAALQHAGALQSCTSGHLLVALQAGALVLLARIRVSVCRVLAAELSLHVSCMKNMQETSSDIVQFYEGKGYIFWSLI